MGVLVPTGSVGVKVNHGFTVSVSENRYKKYGAPQLDFIFTAGSIENVVTSENPISFVRNSPATFYDSSGILRTVSANEPRFDHNSITGEKLGLLIEESRVNSLRYSQDFTDALWVKTSATIIPNSVIAPDGTLTGSTMKADAGTAILPTVSQDAGDAAIRTLSLYAKMGTYRYLKINPRGQQYALVVDLQDGSVYATGNTGVVSADIVPAPNGWYRLILTTDQTSSTRIFAIRFATNPNNASASDFDGTETVHIWGAQLETGSFPTSYIPTIPTFTSRASVATFYNENGTVSTASTDVARNNAYFPNENGVMTNVGLLLESAATNLLLHSEQFGLYSPSEVDVRPNNNLAPDLSFTAGSIVETTTTDYHQLFLYPMQATGNITLSGFIKNKQGTRNALLKFNDGTNDLGFYFNPSSGNTVGVLTGAGTTEPINYGSQKLGNDWYRIYVSGNVSSTGGASSLHIIDNSTYSTHAGTGTDGFYIWGFQMEENSYPTSYIETPATFSSRSQTNSDSASFYQSDGTIGYAATNVARDNVYLPDENGTFYPAGLLLEEDRTNILINSDLRSPVSTTNISLADFGFDPANTVDPSGLPTTSAPDGGLASKLVFANGYTRNAGDNTYRAGFFYAHGSGVSSRIISVFVKPAEWTGFEVRYGNQSSNRFFRYFDLTGAGNCSNSDCTITLISNGWYRITLPNDNQNRLSFIPSTSYQSSSTGDGTSGIYIWGAQLEEGSFPTSYIPTTSSTATRGRDFISSGITSTRSADVSSGVTSTRQADDAIISGVAFSSFYNLTEGSFFVHGGPDQINSSSVQHLFSASDGSNSDQTRIKVNAGVSSVTFNVRDGSVAQADININSVVAGNNDSKIAARYGANDFRIDVQGSSGTDTSGTVSSSLTQLAIGSRTNDRYLNGHIRRLTYWPTKLSDAQLERITQQ